MPWSVKLLQILAQKGAFHNHDIKLFQSKPKILKLEHGMPLKQSAYEAGANFSPYPWDRHVTRSQTCTSVTDSVKNRLDTVCWLIRNDTEPDDDSCRKRGLGGIRKAQARGSRGAGTGSSADHGAPGWAPSDEARLAQPRGRSDAEFYGEGHVSVPCSQPRKACCHEDGRAPRTDARIPCDQCK